MFNKKYNPDIVKNYNNMEKSYIDTKYELKNEPYKLIIEDDINKLNNNNFPKAGPGQTGQWQINLDENKKDIINDFNILYKNRNIKINQVLTKENMNKIKEKFKLKHTELFNNDIIPEDYDDIKEGFVSDYKIEELELKKGRTKFNNILDSLLEEGLLE